MREWNIQAPARVCVVTGRIFDEGEPVYSELVDAGEGLLRRDYCEEAWNARNDSVRPASFWRTAARPAAPPKEAVSRDDARGLLHRLLAEGRPESRNAIYILAAMLERKRLIKEVDRLQREEGTVIVYEETASGETLLVIDPKLRLDQLAAVQTEVAALLGGPGEAPAPAAPPESTPSS